MNTQSIVRAGPHPLDRIAVIEAGLIAGAAFLAVRSLFTIEPAWAPGTEAPTSPAKSRPIRSAESAANRRGTRDDVLPPVTSGAQ